jgi:threonine/homoserine/homoserine lactone efflux protein
MKLYPLFLLMAALTVLSPGPGVVMTLTNSVRFGLKGTIGGILGISFGALVVATISATSLGILLAASAVAFTIIKFAGAAYLAYLGIRLWRAPAFQITETAQREAGFGKRFLEGLSLQLTNPKAIFFFLSVFPQFIDPEMDYFTQFAVQVLTYSSLVVVIHCLYALFAQSARTWLTSERVGTAINKTGGTILLFFGAALAFSKRTT